MSSFAEYFGFMNSYLSFFENVKEKEREKMQALLSNDLKRIESSMQEHQTNIKKIELLEKQRRELSDRLGFGEKDFREITELFEGEERNSLASIRIKLQNTVKSIRYLNKKSEEIATMQLNYYGELAAAEEAHMYNAKGKPEVAGANLLNAKV